VSLSRVWAGLSVLVLMTGVVSCATRQPDGAVPTEPRGRIALTFDDAPLGDGAFFTGAERTERLISGLDEAGVRGAMLFVLTENIAAEPGGAARLQAYAHAGFLLANHTHAHSGLSNTETEAFLAGIDEAASILSSFDGQAPYFRFPYLDEGRPAEKRDAVRAGLKARGLRQGYVTIDNYDWYMNALAAEAVSKGHPLDMEALGAAYVENLVSDVEFYDEIARATLGRSPAHVLLLHENDLAALFVGDLVGALRAQGWQIVTAEEAFADPIADEQPDTLFNGQGRIAALAYVSGLYKRTDLIAPNEDEDWLRADFFRRGLLPPE